MLKPQWLKKSVSKREWTNFYSLSGNYYKLSEERYGGNNDIIIGFMSAGLVNIPDGCVPMNEYELRDMDLFCERENLYPRPFNYLTK